jgi:hypothetical protein
MDLQDRLPLYSIRTGEIPCTDLGPSAKTPPLSRKLRKVPEIKMESGFHMMRAVLKVESPA